MEYLSNTGLLSEDTLRAIDQKNAPFFRRTWRPFSHQAESFKLLLSQDRVNSVIVSSGTGSGKTECFLIPLIEDMARELRRYKETGKRKPRGVRALFLYPLNALIDSQQERLQNWTKDFDGDVRFALYNGLTTDRLSRNDPRVQEHREQIFDRESIRKIIPDFLVTNPSMLERVILRPSDSPIIEASRKNQTFRWVIIDEAHTYTGSKAADLALLLRRTLNAFGMDPAHVHFVATSATVDDRSEGARQGLKKFLMELSGADENHVHLVLGEREIPKTAFGLESCALKSLDELETTYRELGNEALVESLLQSQIAMKIRNVFIDRRVVKLSELCEQTGLTEEEILRWLDLLTAPKNKDGSPSLLSLRLHQMLNTMPVPMVCPNKDCPARDEEFRSSDWHYGQVWLDGSNRCSCGAPLFPLTSCRACNAVFLKGVDQDGSLLPEESGREPTLLWNLIVENGQGDLAGPEESSEQEKQDNPAESVRIPVLISNVPSQSSETGFVELAPSDRSERSSLGVDVCFPDPEDGRLACPVCGMRSRPDRWFQRSLPRGYFDENIPFILEKCSADKVQPDLPMQGRKLITFTDSRQGCARTAAQIERAGERSYLVSRLFAALQDSEGQSSMAPQKRRFYEQQLQSPNLDPEVRKLLETELAESSVHRLSWNAFQEGLSEDLDGYGGHNGRKMLSESMWQENADAKKTARILLLREFINRPINGVSLETCGLVSLCYPALQLITTTPPTWPLDLGLSGWRAYLKVIVDHVIRETHAVDLGYDWTKHGGNMRIFMQVLMPPETSPSQKLSKGFRRWPRVHSGSPASSSRIVHYTAKLFGIDLDSVSSSDCETELINGILSAAFDDLVRVNLLRSRNSGFVMQPEMSVSFYLNSSGWKFPGVKQVFDTIVGEPAKAVCPINPDVIGAVRIDLPKDIPNLSRQWSANPDAARAELRRFEQQNPALRTLREEGLWNRIGTMAIERVGFFSAAEHTAQLEQDHKRRLIEWFKEGTLNVLACSTTMEMGVDLSGINTVVQNNVPPHPANYMQRAGRAGRRGETRANVLTVCGDTTRDRNVFKAPDWAMREPLPMPVVMLQSETIVQRHVNAELLSCFFLLQKSEIDPHKLLYKDWINGPQKLFLNWLSSINDKEEHGVIARLKRLVKQSPLESVSVVELAQRTRRAFEVFANNQQDVVDRIQKQQSKCSDEVGKKSLSFQLKRVTEAKILEMLVHELVLPSSIVVTGTTEFLTVHSGKEDTIDEMPSRAAEIGIWEYAPGSSVVIDNFVYKSRGLTLNWKIPMTVEGIREIQKIETFSECQQCGRVIVEPSAIARQSCPVCGSSLNLQKAIFPSGFAVSDGEDPHNDLSRIDYSPRVPAVVTMTTSSQPVPGHKGVEYRSDPSGTILSYNKGDGEGFWICLCCGWAEKVSNDGSKPERHRPLRRSTAKELIDEDGYCVGGSSGHEFQIQKLVLTARRHTDCLELTFDAPTFLSDRSEFWNSTGTGLAVCLRRAICRYFGIDEEEIGISVRPAWGGKLSIGLYGKNGSGYCSRVDPLLPKLLDEAEALLNCQNQCQAACTGCLLCFDTRFQARVLDRHDALKLLRQLASKTV